MHLYANKYNYDGNGCSVFPPIPIFSNLKINPYTASHTVLNNNMNPSQLGALHCLFFQHCPNKFKVSVNSVRGTYFGCCITRNCMVELCFILNKLFWEEGVVCSLLLLSGFTWLQYVINVNTED